MGVNATTRCAVVERTSWQERKARHMGSCKRRPHLGATAMDLNDSGAPAYLPFVLDTLYIYTKTKTELERTRTQLQQLRSPGSVKDAEVNDAVESVERESSTVTRNLGRSLGESP